MCDLFPLNLLLLWTWNYHKLNSSKHGAWVPQEWKCDTKSLIPGWFSPGHKSGLFIGGILLPPPRAALEDAENGAEELHGPLRWGPSARKDCPDFSTTQTFCAWIICSGGLFCNGGCHQIAQHEQLKMQSRKPTRCTSGFLNNRKLKLSAEGKWGQGSWRVAAPWCPCLWKTSSCLRE